MIKEAERYARVCAQIDAYRLRSQETFNRFVSLSLATVGGFVWLSTQPPSEKLAEIFPIIRWILPALAVITVIELMLDYKGWWGFRKAEAELLEMPDLAPRFPYSGRSELLRCAVAVVIGAVGYCWLR